MSLLAGAFLPDFLCIGAQKSGTTWLYNQLKSDRRIALPRKEARLLHEAKPETLERSYRRSYGLRNIAKIKGDVDPIYAVSDRALENVAASKMNDTVFFMILREPVARAHSQYKMARSLGNIAPTLSFREAFEENRQNLRRRGEYLSIIERYKTAIGGKGELVLLPFEWIGAKPKPLLEVIYARLGMEPRIAGDLLNKRFGASGEGPALSPADLQHAHAHYETVNRGLAAQLWWEPDWAT